MSTELTQAQRLMLERARAIDLEILNRYLEKEVVMETRGATYGGKLTEIGSDFVHLTKVIRYGNSLRYLEDTPLSLERFDSVVDRTISRSEIRELVPLEDIIKQGENRK